MLNKTQLRERINKMVAARLAKKGIAHVPKKRLRNSNSDVTISKPVVVSKTKLSKERTA